MQLQILKTLTMTILFFLSLKSLGQSSTSYEVTCRSKAKEIAALSYKNCMTDARSAEMEQLKNSYNQDLKALKTRYEAKISRLSGETKSQKVTEPATTSKAIEVTEDSVLPEPIDVQ